MTDEKQIQEQADEEMINQGFQELLDSYLATKHRKKVEIITKAFNFAKQAHKGVKRRSGEPYIMHPIAVAKIVCTEIGLGSTSICSALLHDVVEDTDYRQGCRRIRRRRRNQRRHRPTRTATQRPGPHCHRRRPRAQRRGSGTALRRHRCGNRRIRLGHRDRKSVV